MADVNTPRVWIGCVACYNAGNLVGDWYPATEAGDITTSQLHGRNVGPETHEELWCLDVENFPEAREMDPMTAQLWGEIYEEVGLEQWPALCAWVRSGSYIAEGDTDFPVLGDFEERYAGEWSTFREYAEQLADDIGLLRDVPEEVERYFDWDSWTRDLRFDYTVEPCPTGGVYVFRA